MNARDLETDLRDLFATGMSAVQRQELDRRFAGIVWTRHRAVATPLRGRRRQAMVLVAAAMAVLLMGALAALSATPPRSPAQVAADEAWELKLRDDPVLLATANGCSSLNEAAAVARERLDALGLDTWTIETRDGAENFRCVTYAPIGDGHMVIIAPSMGGDVNQVIERVKVTLMQQCLTWDAAAALLHSELAPLGWDRWTVRPGGPFGYPIGQEQAVESHVAQGCSVFSRAQSWPDGTYLFYLYGR